MKPKVKLFIHDSFFESFAQLPKAIQKKTRELMRKFRENPTSSAINYEKIISFTDPTLRTVRVDQKYRAIVKAPEKGDAFTLLWVDNHDEAMDWAKNKVFEFNESTQAFQLYEKPEPQEILTKEQLTPKEEVVDESLSISFTDDQLLRLGTPESLLSMVRTLSNVDDLDALRDKLPKDNYEYLYYLLEGISFEEIAADIELGYASDSDDLSSNARRSLLALTDDAQIEEYLTGDLQKWKLFLHPSQRALAFGDFKGPTKVLGGAGTGKTVCAIHRLKYLVEKLDTFSKPVLFTTYTKSLSKYLSDTVSELSLKSDRFEIVNIDQLALKLAKQYEVVPESSGLIFDSSEEKIWLEVLKAIPSHRDQYFLSEEYNQVILKHKCQSLEDYLKAPRTGRSVRIGRRDKMEIWDQYQEYLKKRGSSFTKNELCVRLSDHLDSTKDRPYSHLICDELQDFGSIELTLLRKLVDETENDLFFVGDPYQNIYNKQINFSHSKINVKGRRSKKLRVNYRTTEEIKRFAIKTISSVKKDDFDGGQYDPKGYVSLVHGESPEYVLFADFDQECSFILSRIENARKHFSDGDICIAARTKYYLDRVKAYLSKQNIGFEDLGKEDLGSHAINLSTFHNMKGHEFQVVILVGVSSAQVPYTNFPNYDYFDDVQKVDYENAERSLLYVAISRAIQSLSILGVGEKSKFLA